MPAIGRIASNPFYGEDLAPFSAPPRSSELGASADSVDSSPNEEAAADSLEELDFEPLGWRAMVSQPERWANADGVTGYGVTATSGSLFTLLGRIAIGGAGGAGNAAVSGRVPTGEDVAVPAVGAGVSTVAGWLGLGALAGASAGVVAAVLVRAAIHSRMPAEERARRLMESESSLAADRAREQRQQEQVAEAQQRRQYNHTVHQLVAITVLEQREQSSLDLEDPAVQARVDALAARYDAYWEGRLPGDQRRPVRLSDSEATEFFDARRDVVLDLEDIARNQP
jgi:hypothetical protein